ncbi:unnamed protein product, partial [Porites evermanni]
MVMYRCSEIYSPDPGKGCQTTGKQAQSNGRKDMMYDFELINLTTRVKLKEWIKNLTFIEPDEKTTTLLRNWLLWYFISQCGRSTDSNNLKV